MPSEALRSVKSCEWYSPPYIVEAARVALGGKIDLDPASCAEANVIVRAERYYSKERAPLYNGGELMRWDAPSVFCNPPSGLVNEFWFRMIDGYNKREFDQAIWIGYSLQQLQTLQRFKTTPLDFPICFPKKRIAFTSPAGDKKSPTHSNYICYLPPVGDCLGVGVERFNRAFETIGRVINVNEPT